MQYLDSPWCYKYAFRHPIRDIASLRELVGDWCMFATWFVFLYHMTSCTRSRASSHSTYRQL